MSKCKTCNGTGFIVRTFTGSVGLESEWRPKGSCGAREDEQRNCPDCTENERLRQWIADLQSGMYINCIYCGHRYGPKENTPVSMADILKQHIEKCPEHPMSKLNELVDWIEKVSCGEEQIDSDGAYDDADALKVIYNEIKKYKRGE